jgi:apolipoprotein N-acyltransferase
VRARNSYLLAFLSGILLFLSYPPCNLGFFAWFAFVPALVAIYYETRAKRIDRLLLITAICLVPLFVWLYNEFDAFLPVVVAWPLGVIGAAFMAGYITWFAGDYWKPRQMPRKELSYLPSGLQIFILPILGTAMEFLIMNVPVIMKIGGAFGFFSLSRTQWLTPPILQLASFTGMYGVTFLILLVNSALAHAVVHHRETKRISKQAIAVLAIFAAIFVWGWVSLPEVTTGDTGVVIIQAKPSNLETQHINNIYAELSEYSLKYEPEIILWSIWSKYEPMEIAGPIAAQYVDFSQEHNVYLTDIDNIVFPDGNIEHYDAPYLFTHVFDGLVPFNLNGILPKIDGFDTRSGELGLLVCMESASTIPARQLVKNGTKFIAVTSADRPVIGAFQGLIGGNLVYRAVEHRIYTALFFRDNGSIIVDPYGRIVDDIAPEEEIVAGKIAFTSERPFYSRYGDIFGWSVVGLWVALLGYNFYLKRRSPYIFCKECRAEIAKDADVCEQCGASQKKPPLWKRILFHEYYEHIDRYKGKNKTKPK